MCLAESKGDEYQDPVETGTQISRLACDLGVDSINLRSLNGDALVVEKTSGHYMIFLNKDHSKARHRFSIAHELSHLLILPIVSPSLHVPRSIAARKQGSTQDNANRKVENLCNEMASAILMPRKRIEPLLVTPPTAKCIPTLIKDFEVSFEAAARRYISIVPEPCIMVKWSMKSGLRKEERPITNFRNLNLRDVSWVEFLDKPLKNPPGFMISKERVRVYRHAQGVRNLDAYVETARHGLGKYQRMFSFIYLSSFRS